MIDVESKFGDGSTFYIYLPAVEGTVEKPGELSGCQNVAEHVSGKILVMDDDYIIREVTCKILTEAGYDVVKVDCGEKAIEIYKEHMKKNNPFNVVILDLTVPGGMGGKETISELKKIDPEVRAIATSGYSEDPVISKPEEYSFLTSPGSRLNRLKSLGLKKILGTTPFPEKTA